MTAAATSTRASPSPVQLARSPRPSPSLAATTTCASFTRAWSGPSSSLISSSSSLAGRGRGLPKNCPTGIGLVGNNSEQDPASDQGPQQEDDGELQGGGEGVL